MDSQLLRDWISMCEEGRSFDHSYFYGLFMDSCSLEELRSVFQTFPDAEGYVSALLRIKSGGHSQFDSNERIRASSQLIREDVERMRVFLSKINEHDLADSFLKNNVVFVDLDVFKSISYGDDAWPSSEAMSAIGDCFRDVMDGCEEKYWQLNEAVYGATNDYRAVWYVASNGFDFGYDFSLYMDIRGLGVQYLVCETGIYAVDLRAV
ncbi:hypothetical protein [Lysobacter brunescens]|uniref:Uncharacterized protein n=1 Tax=Lysobacter brunescens TaxID=262323 RepID=A0ABW2YH75_9GAMM